MSTATARPLNALTEEPGIRFVAEGLDCERRFIRDGWLDPVRMNNAGADAGLRGEHFSEDSHSFLFAYICTAAARGDQLSIEKVEQLAATQGVLMTAEDVRFIVKGQFEPVATPCGTLEELAREIVAHHNQVQRYRDLQRQAAEILDRDPGPPKTPKKDSWPAPPDAAAYHGPAGELVALIDPATEADPVAVLISFLVAFGNAIGRSAYFMADGARHFANMFAVLIGATSKGRKGTSWNRQAEILRDVDQEWAPRIMGGLSSGEGLIWAVRDPIIKKEKKKGKNGEPDTVEFVVVDSGESDKRLMILESEFAGVLKVLSREGNNLSVIVRQAWESGELRSITKNAPAQATNAHISIIGHITGDELREKLDSNETTNGLGNRFLWFAVRRSKELPDGGCIPRDQVEPISRTVAAAVDFAKTCGQMTRDAEAKATWHAIYHDLSEAKPGLAGSLTSRSEAQVMRLAMIYALLDRSVVIRQVHLEAALAVWEYCEASVTWCFGSKIGNTTADTIIDALTQAGAAGMSRTEISSLFGRNLPSEKLSTALKTLLDRGLARRDFVRQDDGKGGRPIEMWWKV